ncbi:MAG: hypothetical protein MHMPM18_000036 [Marteilia pararefringens]
MTGSLAYDISSYLELCPHRRRSKESPRSIRAHLVGIRDDVSTTNHCKSTSFSNISNDCKLNELHHSTGSSNYSGELELGYKNKDACSFEKIDNAEKCHNEDLIGSRGAQVSDQNRSKHSSDTYCDADKLFERSIPDAYIVYNGVDCSKNQAVGKFMQESENKEPRSPNLSQKNDKTRFMSTDVGIIKQQGDLDLSSNSTSSVTNPDLCQMTPGKSKSRDNNIDTPFNRSDFKNLLKGATLRTKMQTAHKAKTNSIIDLSEYSNISYDVTELIKFTDTANSVSTSLGSPKNDFGSILDETSPCSSVSSPNTPNQNQLSSSAAGNTENMSAAIANDWPESQSLTTALFSLNDVLKQSNQSSISSSTSSSISSSCTQQACEERGADDSRLSPPDCRLSTFCSNFGEVTELRAFGDDFLPLDSSNNVDEEEDEDEAAAAKTRALINSNTVRLDDNLQQATSLLSANRSISQQTSPSFRSRTWKSRCTACLGLGRENSLVSGANSSFSKGCNCEKLSNNVALRSNEFFYGGSIEESNIKAARDGLSGKRNKNFNLHDRSQNIIVSKMSNLSRRIERNNEESPSKYGYKSESNKDKSRYATRFTSDQNHVLLNWYSKNQDMPYATDNTINELSLLTNLSEKSVRKWLSNKRSRKNNTNRLSVVVAYKKKRDDI